MSLLLRKANRVILEFFTGIFIFATMAFGGMGSAFAACESNQIDVLGDGTQCETAKFSITTTNLTANTTFKFAMSAMGTFYVDWGDGTVDTITRDNTTPSLYDHKYTTAGIKTIRFGGLATGYSTEEKIAAISFGYYLYQNLGMSGSTYSLVKSINGSLGAIFPTLTQSESGTLKQPKFISTFEQTGIDSIPENLFSGVSGGVYKMFDSTFLRTQITSIPENLFAGITGGETGGRIFSNLQELF